jgi:hypothetical protein
VPALRRFDAGRAAREDQVTLLSGHRPGYTRLVFGVLGLVGETRGTEVFIQDKSNTCRTIAFTVR